jgi:hypothetical protein
VADEPREKPKRWFEPDPPELGGILSRAWKFLLMVGALALIVRVGHLPGWVFAVGGLVILLWWMGERSNIPWGEGRGRKR